MPTIQGFAPERSIFSNASGDRTSRRRAGMRRTIIAPAQEHAAKAHAMNNCKLIGKPTCHCANTGLGCRRVVIAPASATKIKQVYICPFWLGVGGGFCKCDLTCKSSGVVGYDDVWGRRRWSPKRRKAPLLPVERTVRPHHAATRTRCPQCSQKDDYIERK